MIKNKSMSKIILKEFQKKAINELKEEFLHRLIKSGKQEIKFEAPTGSGKTIMMADFVRSLILQEPRLEDTDLCFLWVSIGGSKDDSLVEQSKNKFSKYYDGANGIKISTLENIKSNKILNRNEILFFNWAKITSRNKEDRKLRRQSEWDNSWDKMLRETKKNNPNRKIILLIDEAHRNKDTELSEEEIKLINPKIVIHITATHKDNTNIDVKVNVSDVKDEGIIKLYIESQTEEDFKKNKNKDLDETILSLALDKKSELDELYAENSIAVNPLLLIQLPHDTKYEEDNTKKDYILSLLNKYNIKKEKIAIWLSGEKKIGDVNMKDLSSITNNQSDVDILIFKDAVATGWDCPRAQILIMYREVGSPTFRAQLLGRILRTPEGKHYDENKLNISYLYTNYNKKSIAEGYNNHQGANETKINYTEIKKEIQQIELETYTSQRIDYNDIGKSFQKTFFQVAKKKYKNLKELEKAGFELVAPSDNILANVQIENYDDFISAGEDSGTDIVADSSRLDIEKMYRKLCRDLLMKQDIEDKYGNIARSYSKIKSALNVWFEEGLGFQKKNGKEGYYNFIVNDLIKINNSNSVLLTLINEALREYKPIREKELIEKAKEKEEKNNKTKKINIPKTEEGYTSSYQIVKDFKKCVYEDCYIKKSDINEKSTGEYAFINHLENNKNVIWWYKSGNSGAEYFSVRKDDGRLFFPDFFIKTKNHIYIIDTKGDLTLGARDIKLKIKALNNWQKEHKKDKENYLVGFAKLRGNEWWINNDDELKDNKWEKMVIE